MTNIQYKSDQLKHSFEVISRCNKLNMNISDSDKYPIHNHVAPNEVMSARYPGVVDMHTATRSTRVVPALGAEIEMPASTAEQGSQMEGYQEADWKSALHAGDTRESETNKYTLDGNGAMSSLVLIVLCPMCHPVALTTPRSLPLIFARIRRLTRNRLVNINPRRGKLLKAGAHVVCQCY